jgi:hypothetical protein
MEHQRTPAEGGAHAEFGEGIDRDYILAASGMLPEAAIGELPWWAWALCTAVLGIFTLLLIRFA